MKSMTGFGQAIGSVPQSGIGFRTELSSINRKQLELKMMLPRELASFEIPVRTLLGKYISRGSVSVRVDLMNAAGTSALPVNLGINSALAEKLFLEAQELELKLGIGNKLSLADILSIPGVVDGGQIDFSAPELEHAFLDTVERAAAELVHSRICEGNNLKQDLAARLQILRDSLEQVIEPVKRNPVVQQERLLQKLKESGLEMDPNDERFLREVVFFLDRADVTEEITRLRSHFSQFDHLLCDDANPVGRTLDFLVQEIFREINTLGNKAASVEVSPVIVKMKTELEKIREQIQNIE